MSYLRSRLHERSTWIGLGILLIVIAYAIYVDRIQIRHMIGAAISAIMMAASETGARRILAALRPLDPKTVTPLPGAPVMASSDFISFAEKSLVSLVTSYATANALGTEEKALIDAVLQAYRTESVGDILTVIQDVLTIVAALRAQIPPTQATQPQNGAAT